MAKIGMIGKFRGWAEVSATDADDARRRKLLNLLLLGVAAVTVLGMLATFFVSTFVFKLDRAVPIYLGGAAALVGIALIWVVNRSGPGWLASVLFLLLLALVFGFSDEPKQVVDGRSLFLFAIPILVASVVLRSWGSFIIAGLVDVLLTFVALNAGLVPNAIGMLGLFVVALVAWIASRSLERALEELRAINRELDQRVADRTRELAETLSENQAILTSIADGVIVFDTDGKATVANPSTAELLGKSEDQVAGRSVQELIQEDVSPEDRQVIVNIFNDKEKDYPSFKVQWGTKTLSLSYAPVRDPSNQVIGAVAVFRDFTREAELERMKSAFVSMVSHELRTPLNAILGYADMLNEGIYGQLTEKQNDVMRRVMANARRQLSLVNDLLDSAQIEAGTLSLNFVKIAPVELINDMRSTLIILAESKSLELVCRIAEDMPETVIGDSQRLHQILINLVNNAIKFTERGSVRVDIARSGNSDWSIQVTDTGPGIPSEAQGYIFQPFRRVDSSATRKQGGAGLGLSIVKQLANLMVGEVSLQSEVGQGSTFTVVLPLVPTLGAKEK